MVTKAAMIITKIGMRISLGTQFRIIDTVVFEPINTSVVASPKPSPLVIVAVTASKGHKPNSCTNAGLFFHRPCQLNSLNSFISLAHFCINDFHSVIPSTGIFSVKNTALIS